MFQSKDQQQKCSGCEMNINWYQLLKIKKYYRCNHYYCQKCSKNIDLTECPKCKIQASLNQEQNPNIIKKNVTENPNKIIQDNQKKPEFYPTSYAPKDQQTKIQNEIDNYESKLQLQIVETMQVFKLINLKILELINKLGLNQQQRQLFESQLTQIQEYFRKIDLNYDQVKQMFNIQDQTNDLVNQCQKQLDDYHDNESFMIHDEDQIQINSIQQNLYQSLIDISYFSKKEIRLDHFKNIDQFSPIKEYNNTPSPNKNIQEFNNNQNIIQTVSNQIKSQSETQLLNKNNQYQHNQINDIDENIIDDDDKEDEVIYQKQTSFKLLQVNYDSINLTPLQEKEKIKQILQDDYGQQTLLKCNRILIFYQLWFQFLQINITLQVSLYSHNYMSFYFIIL